MTRGDGEDVTPTTSRDCGSAEPTLPSCSIHALNAGEDAAEGLVELRHPVTVGGRSLRCWRPGRILQKLNFSCHLIIIIIIIIIISVYWLS